MQIPRGYRDWRRFSKTRFADLFPKSIERKARIVETRAFSHKRRDTTEAKRLTLQVLRNRD